MSIPYVRCHSFFIDDFTVYRDSVFADDLWISCDIGFLTASAMTLYLLSIGSVVHEFGDAVDFIRRLSLSIHCRFQVLQGLCFHWRFVDQQWHSVFDNSMRQPWLYFCYRFDALVENSLMLSIPCVSCNLVFIDDNRDSVLTDDLWIISDIAFLTIPWVSHHSIFAIGLMCR